MQFTLRVAVLGLVLLPSVASHAQRAVIPDAVDRAGQMIERGAVDAAVAELRALKSQRPRDPRIPYYLGLASAKKGDYAAALKDYDQALSLNPALVEALNNRAMALLELGRVGPAIEAAQKVVQQKPNFGEGHYNLGLALERKGDWASAER